MSVTQAHQGLGSWTLNLRPGAADELVSRLRPWGHVFICPKGTVVKPELGSVKRISLFSGRIDQVSADGGGISIGGPSVAVWMGDESGNGCFPDAAQASATTTAYGAFGWFGLMFANTGNNLNGLFLGTWQNIQTGNFTWEFDRFLTIRQKLDQLAELMDRPFEWIVRPSGEIQIEGWVPSGRTGYAYDSGANSTIDYTSTIFNFLPRVMLGAGLNRGDGNSTWTTPVATTVPMTVFPADVGVTWDYSQFAARGIARASSGALRSTGTNKNDYGTNGYSFEPTNRIGWDTIVDFDTTDTTLLQAAANSVGRLASSRREWSVEAGGAELVPYIKPGDYVWLHSDSLPPGLASMTYAEEEEFWAGVGASTDPVTQRRPQAAEVKVYGRSLYPARARVQSMDWAVSDRFDVFYCDTWSGSTSVELLNPYIDWDPEGPVRLDCNGNPPRWQMQRKVLGVTVAKSVDLNANTRSAR